MNFKTCQYQHFLVQKNYLYRLPWARIWREYIAEHQCKDERRSRRRPRCRSSSWWSGSKEPLSILKCWIVDYIKYRIQVKNFSLYCRKFRHFTRKNTIFNNYKIYQIMCTIRSTKWKIKGSQNLTKYFSQIKMEEIPYLVPSKYFCKYVSALRFFINSINKFNKSYLIPIFFRNKWYTNLTKYTVN